MKFNHFLLPNSNNTSNNPDSELARMVNKGDGEGTLPTNVFPVARLLHIKGRLPVLLCAVKTVEGDFRFCLTITPNVGQTHKENPNLVRILYMVCTLNDIYKQYNKLHEH